MTLAQLKAEIDAADGDLRLTYQLNRRGESIRLIIRCKNRSVPEAWAMAMLYQNVRFDCIDFHQTDYRDADGTRRLGWHRDLRENDRTIQKVCLASFKPATLDQFIVEALALFNIILSPGDEDANGQLHLGS